LAVVLKSKPVASVKHSTKGLRLQAAPKAGKAKN
jgi:hypothetical protein